jgi:hypothetical protein
MVISFKDIHQIFLNGIYFKELRIYQILLKWLANFNIFRKNHLTPFIFVQLTHMIILFFKWVKDS